MNLDMTTIRLLKTWVPAAALFFFIAVVCISAIFSQIKEYKLFEDGSKIITTQSPLSYIGGSQIAASWTERPNYVIGLGIAAFLSFLGAIYCVVMIEHERKNDDEKKIGSGNNI